MSKRRVFGGITALKGIQSHGGFLGEETLMRLASAERFDSIRTKHLKEPARAFRDSYREFAERIERQSSRSKQKPDELIREWMKSTLTFLGYGSFVPKSISHWVEGTLIYLASKEKTHSVGVFLSVTPKAPDSAFDSGDLTGPDGSLTSAPVRAESLCEQVERAIKEAGLQEAVLLLPHAAYYFRADSQMSGQCLEINWRQILSGDWDDALCMARHLVGADFFEMAAIAGAESEEELEGATATEDDDTDVNDEDEEDEESGGGAVDVRLTPSSELFKEDLEQARQITEELHRQVTLSLELLINERLEVDPELKKQALTKAKNNQISYDLFKDGLFVLYRMLFVLFAEARGYLPSLNEQFTSFYSMEHLRDWAEAFERAHRRGLANPDGTYLWGTLQSLFTLLRRGVELQGGEQVSPYNGQLFAPHQCPLFENGPALRDEAMSRVLLSLTRITAGNDRDQRAYRKLHFGNLGIEQLGAVYEALLAQQPLIVREKSLWVPAGKNNDGVALVTEAFAHAMELETFSEEGPRQGRGARRGARISDLDAFIPAYRPARDPKLGRFALAPSGGTKRQTASFYTPPKLAEFLVKRTLRPLVEGKTPNEILALRLVEPAVGSGGFLIAAVRYLGQKLLEAKVKSRALELRDGKPQAQDLQRCKREVVENCLFGVDINPLALELARTSLYLECIVPGEPLPFLHHRLQAGNSLVGADFQGRAQVDWDEHEPIWALFDIPHESLKVAKDLWKAWDDAEESAGREKSSPKHEAKLKEKLSELKTEKKRLVDHKAWADRKAEAITRNFLPKALEAQREFEKLQSSSAIIDEIEKRYHDHQLWIPDQDPVLIEVHGVETDPKLLALRRRALLKEYGDTTYRKMVAHQRAATRLRLLGHLSCALWFWPLDRYNSFPTYAVYREVCDYLLDSKTLDPKNRAVKKLSLAALNVLKIVVQVNRQQRFFHWDIEFASVMANQDKGFKAVISNPPWKVVGVKDKEVYPEVDPQFMKTKPSEKAKRLKKLFASETRAAGLWAMRFRASQGTSQIWKSSYLAPLSPSGKQDLATLFTIRSERILGEKGRAGLLVSRSAALTSKGTKTLRQRFFGYWGLEESISFINRLRIFEIASYIEFTCLVGQPGKRAEKKKDPTFVHGVLDPNSLDQVSRSLDLVSQGKPIDPATRHIPIVMSEKQIERIFSRENLSIPGLSDPRQLELAEALHKAAGPVTYLSEIDARISQGINQTTGPKNGLSEFTQNIPAHELPKFEDVLAGKVGKWVPLLKGRQFDLFTPFATESQSFESQTHDLKFEQYARRSSLEELHNKDLHNSTLAWRRISLTTNQRSLICSILPPGSYSENTAWLVKSKHHKEIRTLEILLGSIWMDSLVKMNGGSDRTYGEVAALPLSNVTSNYLEVALTLRDPNKNQNEISKNIDALVGLHYFGGDLKKTLWALDTLIALPQFATLQRHQPDYFNQVRHWIHHYNQTIPWKYDPTPIFTLKSKGAESEQVQAPTAKRTRKRAA